MWVLQSYNNINACILFLPLIIVFGEVDEILARSDLLVSVCTEGRAGGLASAAYPTL